ncbi:MAG: hypothetical protein ACAH65_12150 [Chloroflexota bacterium]
MTPYERASSEASRRVELLPSEVAGWIVAAQANAAGFGIHRSQLLALQDMLEILTRRQRDLVANRPQPAATGEYAESELEFTAEVVGAYELWSAFRSVFEQRNGGRLKRALDAADLVAADAYRCAIDRAVAWKVVKANEFREPPLVCADAVASPGTAARGQQVAGLTGTIRRFRSKLLPIPLVLFPADRLDDIWTYSTLAHEVGHDLEADLAFSTEAIDAGIAALEAAGVPNDRLEAWRAWGPEVAADAVGVALGGAGFAAGLADWLVSVALAKVFNAPNGDPHPPPHVRVRVLAGLLEGAGVAAWQPLADSLVADMDAAKPPAWQKPFKPDAKTFANAVMTTKLTAFDDHAIVELSPDIAADAILTDKLAKYLRSGFDRPSPSVPSTFPTRLVPSAAAFAVRALAPGANLEPVATRALDYIHDIPRPAFLAAPPPGRREFLKGLAERLDVRPAAAES